MKSQEMHVQLKSIATILKKELIDFSELSEAIQSYKTLVSNISTIEFEGDLHRNDIHFNNGMALGTSWAAMCLDDLIRTKMFVKGVFEAIESIRTKKESPIHILYAGTGPYATLLLPILESYSKDEVVCTLMEINDESFVSMQRMIKTFGFEDHVVNYVQDDATTHQLDEAERIDILVSETMQRALAKEQQVPIVMNLMKQLREDVILIPEKIDVVACLMDTAKYIENPEEQNYCERLESIIELSAKQLKQDRLQLIEKGGQLLFPEKKMVLKKESIEKFNQLTLLTEIQVFGKNWISSHQSGLTGPKVLEELSLENVVDKELIMQYKVDEDPDVIYQFV